MNKIREVDKISLSICQELNDSLIGIIKLIQKVGEQHYKLGQANVLAFIKACFQDDKYKSEYIKQYISVYMDSDEELRDMTYQCMKDWE